MSRESSGSTNKAVHWTPSVPVTFDPMLFTCIAVGSCTDGTRRCLGDVIELCVNGQFLTEQDCTDTGQTCQDGNCQGGVCVLRHTEHDFSCQQQHLSCRSDYYDVQGHLIREQAEPNCDGVAYRCWIYEYDQDGRKEAAHFEPNCDGTDISNCMEYEYANGGTKSIMRRSWDCTDLDPDCWITLFDTAGRKIEEYMDFDCNDTRDSDCVLYAYDQDGKPISSTKDRQCDGIQLSNCITFTYNQAGLLTSEQNDLICDGAHLTDCRTCSYDSQNRLISEQTDTGCDGAQIRYCKTYSYDSETCE